MEGVEDIPGSALHEGLDWSWESFGEYLDALERRPHDIDIGAQVPHAALRLYVMGERGADHTERPTADEIAEMGRAGRRGRARRRARLHHVAHPQPPLAAEGEYTPSLTAEHDELVGIASALGELGAGVLQVVSDFADLDEEADRRCAPWPPDRPAAVDLAGRRLARRRPPPAGARPPSRRCNADGLEMRAQVAARGIGVLLGLQATLNPFIALPVVPRGRRPAAAPSGSRALREPAPPGRHRGRAGPTSPAAVRGRLRAAVRAGRPARLRARRPRPAWPREAARAGRDAADLAYDLLLADDGRALLYRPILNYPGGNLDVARELLVHPLTVPGLGDGGAHVGTICDASFPTTLLAHWCRDRTRGEQLDLPFVVQRPVPRDRPHRRPARPRRARARLPGRRQRHRLRRPAPPPAAARVRPARPAASACCRTSTATGTRSWPARRSYADGEATGALPGRLVRGAQPAPVPERTRR